MRILHNTETLYSARWDSWHEWLDFAQGGPMLCAKHFPNAWAQGTFSQAIDLAKNGWQEGIDKLAKLSTPIVNKLSSLVERPTFDFDVEGQSLDIGTYLNGDPECFLRQTNEVVQGFGTRHLTLAVNIAVSAAISTDTMIARGVFTTALVELLECAGIRVELWVGSVMSYCGTKNELYTKIKTSEQPLDLARVVYALAHPSAFRRLWFSTVEQIPQKFWYYYGIGSPVDHNPPVMVSDINLQGLLSGIDVSSKDSERLLLKTLREQGVTFTNQV